MLIQEEDFINEFINGDLQSSMALCVTNLRNLTLISQ